MITVLYPISFLITLASLVAWFYFQSNKPWYIRLSRVFAASFVFYLLSVAFSDADATYKMGTLFRDLTIIGGIGFVFQVLRKQKSAFVLGAILLVGGMNWFYQSKLTMTFPQHNMDINSFYEEVEKHEVAEKSKDIELNAEGELLVEVNENKSIRDLIDVLSNYNLRYQRAFYPEQGEITDLDDYYLINIPPAQESKLEEIKDALRESGVVDWLEYNETIDVAPIEANKIPDTKKRFGVNDPGVEQLWGFEAMQMDALYNYLKENKVKAQKTALIAILDTGVDSKHEDLAANFKSIKGKYDNDPMGHGTHCAGIAAAVSNNGKGVASFSQNNEYVKVSSIKVLNSYGMGTQKSIIDGIILAADSGADVISMSLGGRSSQSKQTAYKKAVQYANKAGAIVVAAAGNSNRNAKDYSPVNTPGIIGVSAIDSELNRAVFSNTVEDINLGIAAPGVGIYSTIPDNKYAVFNGTSMACPYVSGLIGLMKSVKPDLKTKEAHRILSSTGAKTKSTDLTGKLIQPAAAIKQLLQ